MAVPPIVRELQGRPKHYEELLLTPISVNGGDQCYPGWEQDYGTKRSFYVAGFRWFLYASRIDDFNVVAGFGSAAVKAIAEPKTAWPDMPNTGKLWDECGVPQFKLARNADPIYFPKAALVIVACELALRDRIKENKPLRVAITPEDVYRHMGIVPACWSIEEFTSDAYRVMDKEYPLAEREIKEAAAQDARTFVLQLTKGHTVTLPTATKTADYLRTNCEKVTIGAVTPKPGRHIGKLEACRFESVDVK